MCPVYPATEGIIIISSLSFLHESIRKPSILYTMANGADKTANPLRPLTLSWIQLGEHWLCWLRTPCMFQQSTAHFPTSIPFCLDSPRFHPDSSLCWAISNCLSTATEQYCDRSRFERRLSGLFDHPTIRAALPFNSMVV